jgi:hypothetical protein
VALISSGEGDGRLPGHLPLLWEEVVMQIEEDVRGTFVQDCEVCCNPWLVRATRLAPQMKKWRGSTRLEPATPT